MNISEINVIKYSSLYRESVIELLNTCFPGKNITPESFIWKHLDGFFKGKYVSYLAKIGDRICAFVCFDPIKVIKDNRLTTFYSCSVQATHPDYRRRGLVTLLTKKAEDEIGKGVPFFGFSNSDGVKIDKYSKNINYKILGNIRTAYFLASPLNKYKFRNIDSIVNLEKPIKETNHLQFYKNRNYLDWRYLKNPKNKFEFYEIIDDTVSIGTVVLKKKNLKYELLDIIAAEIYYKSCIEATRNIILKKGAVILSMSFLPNRFWDISFPKYLMIKNTELFFTVKSVEQEFLDTENWIIIGGDIQ